MKAIVRLKGLSPENILLPSKERVHHLTKTPSPLCWCDSGNLETYIHLFFECNMNKEAGEALIRCVQAYDQNLTMEKALRLEIVADETFLLPTVAILATGLVPWRTGR